MSLRSLVHRVTCPHCWHHFEPCDSLFVSSHEDLRGDPRLGPDEMLRFRPSRFDDRGHALDLRDRPCRQLACPACHLPYPSALLEMPPLFLSILGAPGCGKSFCLAALTWEMRRLLSRMGLAFADIDPSTNAVLTGYENSLFLREGGGDLTPLARLIAKTDVGRDARMYAFVSYGSQRVTFTRPFLFSLRPARGEGRVLCLYDNAGEHFQPGQDSSSQPTTRHLAHSQALLFLYDPTQDPRFKERYQKVTGFSLPAGRPYRQETILREAAARVRAVLGLKSAQRIDRPLIVVLTKLDLWHPLVPQAEAAIGKQGDRLVFHPPAFKARSDRLRKLMQETCAEVVAAADEFSSHVRFWAISPLGQAPVQHPQTGEDCLAPGPVKPIQVMPPLLYALNAADPRLVPVTRPPGETGMDHDTTQEPRQ